MPPCLNLYIRSGLFYKMDKKKMSVPLFYWYENDGSFSLVPTKIQAKAKFQSPEIDHHMSDKVEMEGDTAATTEDDQDPFSGGKMRRKASIARSFKGDYVDVSSKPFLMKILDKQGDRGVIFADKVLKFTGSGKMKKRILLITDFAIYLVDPETHSLKRRIALAAVEKLCLSELSDNFFAVIVPTEYDLLLATTRKTEIVTVLVESMKTTSNYELELHLSNSFEYHAASDLIKEIQFEEAKGGVKTKIVNK